MVTMVEELEDIPVHMLMMNTGLLLLPHTLIICLRGKNAMSSAAVVGKVFLLTTAMDMKTLLQQNSTMITGKSFFRLTRQNNVHISE